MFQLFYDTVCYTAKSQGKLDCTSSIGQVVKPDVKIPEILRDFISLVEDEFDDVADADTGMWLSDFIDTDARMMP